jgi:hypothetical protein
MPCGRVANVRPIFGQARKRASSCDKTEPRQISARILQEFCKPRPTTFAMPDHHGRHQITTRAITARPQTKVIVGKGTQS